eukprot:ANDGO_07841.mRNA.1 Phytanoyl-CoA dioxygenase 2
MSGADVSIESCLSRFGRDGYAIIPDFAPPSTLAALKQRMLKIVSGFESSKPSKTSVFTTNEQHRHTDDEFISSSNKVHVFYEQSNKSVVNKIGHDLHTKDDVFRSYSYSSGIEKVCRILGMANPVPVQSMWISKSGRFGGEVSAHQDSTFLQTTPNDTCIGLWLAIDDATVDNGCLYCGPGSHAMGVKRRFNLTEDRHGCTFNTEYKYDTADCVPVEVKAGTLVVLHGAVVHYSYANASAASRHAYSLHVVDLVPGVSDWSASNWLQRPPSDPFISFDEMKDTVFNKQF